MGYGSDPSKFDTRRWSHGVSAFGPSLRLFAEAIGRPLDAVEGSGEVAAARHDTEIAAGTIPAGTVAAQRMIVSGIQGGQPLLMFRATWYCTTDIEEDWDLGATGWHVSVEGDAPLEIEMRFPFALERMAATSPGYTAHRAVNAVPVVCEAEPGIRTTIDLPQVIADLGS
jgi:4-hydroxy-tetrahydrodipicolinate reductase